VSLVHAGIAEQFISKAGHSTVLKMLMQTDQSSTAHSCSFNIDRISKEPSADYRTILRSTTAGKYKDPSFPTNDTLYWTDRPSSNPNNLLKTRTQTITSWKSLSDYYPKALLFGEGGLSLEDTFQSQKLGNCYFIAGCVAYAEDEKRFLDTFVVQATNIKGLYAFNIFIAGVPRVVVLDDVLPFEVNQSTGKEQLFFAKPGIDGAMWGPLLEKLWAKMNGNYELLAAGWQHESLRALSGAPAQDYVCASMTTDEIWKTISEGD
jgi:hypothetical protein